MSYILKYVSDTGEFCMGGGTHDFFKIVSVHGLGLPESERSTAVYSGQRGEQTLYVRLMPRYITVSGDLMKHDFLPEVIGILSKSGVLYVKTSRGVRETEIQACTMEEPEIIGDITRLVFQFAADDPAFFDYVTEREGIYERVDLVEGSFTLPCIFTRRVCGGNFINLSDLDASPVITVICNKTSEANTTLLIKNEDTGAKIELSRKFTAGEIITIDTKNAEITDAYGNNLISAMSDDTYLSEFILKKGDNNISVISSELASDLQVVCEYKKGYLEAVL